jgi:signal transduction histidine kinase/L-asparagine transporter-like permease
MSRQAPLMSPLPQSLTSKEAWGFGFSGLLLWVGTAPAMNAALGPQAIWVWLPGTVIGMLLNLQVKKLGTYFPDVSGGTPNYLTRLLHRFPNLARYGAIGYFIGWVSVPPMNAIILTDLIKANLTPLGIQAPEILMKIGFTILPFIVALSGTRTIGILHACFVFPAIGFLFTFCFQGMGWLSFATDSPGLLPDFGGGINPIDWMKWFLIAIYAVYGCETSSSFVADSRQPSLTLRCLKVTAGLIPIVYLGGSWVLMRLATDPRLTDNAYLNLMAAAKPFWGTFAPAFVTFLITSGCLLSSATAVSNCPRILYQLAQDAYLPPIFAVLSRRGVLEPSLLFTFLLSLICLLWGDLSRIVMITGTAYLASIMALHFGEWIGRQNPATRWSWWSLVFFAIEAAVLVIGGLAWGWQDLSIGLLLPWLVGSVCTQLPRLKVTKYIAQNVTQFWPETWRSSIDPKTAPKSDLKLGNPPKIASKKTDWLAFQITILLGLTCGAMSLGWWVKASLDQFGVGSHVALFSILLVTVAFVGVAIACWTSLPQITAITEAREQLETTLLDLQQAQMKLVQAEKMSSLGQLVAGVAHEINNPVSFIHGNLAYLQEYTNNLMTLTQLYQKHHPQPVPEIQTWLEEIDLDFLEHDLPKVLDSMTLGTDRIRQIVLSLRNFSRLDEIGLKHIDLHSGIESSLLILGQRLNAGTHTPTIQVTKDYGILPQVECYPGAINQVLMNVLMNAIDAIEERKGEFEAGQITIRTSRLNDQWIEIAIADNGTGIEEPIQQQIFDPFFTTKPVGKGIGMGMSISYTIITETHGGQIKFLSRVAQGTEFFIQLPIHQPDRAEVSLSNHP